MATAVGTQKPEVLTPVIVDLGKQKAKDVKQLLKGKGRLLDEVNECIEELRKSGAISNAVQPVILLVKRKAKRPSLMLPRL